MISYAPGTARPALLVGQTILAAEDEAVICQEMEDILRGAGAEMVTTHRIEDAWEAVQSKPLSAAVLDVHLGLEPIDPLCESLSTRGIPFVFSTGDVEAVSARWGSVPVVSKPFRRADLLDALTSALIGTKALEQPPEGLSRIHEHIFQAECRILRQRRLLEGLRASGADTPAAEELLRLMVEAAELMRKAAKDLSTAWMPKPKGRSD